MKEKRTQEITKENMIRIYDEELLKKLNAFYDKNKALIPYKSKFLVDLIELGLVLTEKQEKDKWAFHNNTQTIMESVQYLSKRLNIFLKFSEHFIEEVYEDAVNKLVAEMLLSMKRGNSLKNMNPRIVFLWQRKD